MEIKNGMEDFVLANLDGVLERYPDCCRCEKCRKDIIALALNHLPPKYTSSKMGEIYVRLGSCCAQDEAKIIQEIAKAVEIVSQKPRHDTVK